METAAIIFISIRDTTIQSASAFVAYIIQNSTRRSLFTFACSLVLLLKD